MKDYIKKLGGVIGSVFEILREIRSTKTALWNFLKIEYIAIND